MSKTYKKNNDTQHQSKRENATCNTANKSGGYNTYSMTLNCRFYGSDVKSKKDQNKNAENERKQIKKIMAQIAKEVRNV